ncbi:MAG: 4-hydroxy-tetrahydrodipicolinate reductase [Vicinamibacteria bacterium]
MRVAIVGYGRMGHEVEAVLGERGHAAVVAPRGAFPADCPVGIDFTRPEAVRGNLERALAAGACYVIGTTGWEAQRQELLALVAARSGGVVHAANFSVGVNLFYRIVEQAARLVCRVPEFDPYVVEKHHRLKRDAPSGTAKVLARALEAAYAPRTAETALSGLLPKERFQVAAVRAGGIVGEHTVGFDSGGDEILLEHRARSRRGFASGAVLAAEWIAGRSGVHGFDEVLDELLAGPFGSRTAAAER